MMNGLLFSWFDTSFFFKNFYIRMSVNLPNTLSLVSKPELENTLALSPRGDSTEPITSKKNKRCLQRAGGREALYSFTSLYPD